jgi:hypothetical protein
MEKVKLKFDQNAVWCSVSNFPWLLIKKKKLPLAALLLDQSEPGQSKRDFQD